MIDLTIASNLLPLKNLGSKLRKELDIAVRETAFYAEKQAKIACPVDTGALRASIYTVTKSSNSRPSAMAEATSKYLVKHADKTPPLSSDVPPVTEELRAVVAVGMAYGVYVEYGTARSSAQPFLGPASERTRPFLVNRVSEAIKRASKDSGFKV